MGILYRQHFHKGLEGGERGKDNRETDPFQIKWVETFNLEELEKKFLEFVVQGLAAMPVSFFLLKIRYFISLFLTIYLMHNYPNRTSAWIFSCKFAAYFQNTFSQEHLWRAASGMKYV